MPTYHHRGITPGLVTPAADQDCGDPAPLGASDASPADLRLPIRDEGPTGEAVGLLEQRTADAPIVTDLDAGRKGYVTLQAQYAMAGFELLELSDGSLLAMKWNLCRPLPDLYAATRFLAQVGGA